MGYNYIEGKKRIDNYINSRITIEEKTQIPSYDTFTYENAFVAPVASIFIDIRNSSQYFVQEPKIQTSKMIRSFVSELVEIFQSNPNSKEVGIRGDCVYAIYDAKNKEALKDVFHDACYANTLIRMLNTLLANQSIKTIKAGIGIGYDKNEMILKAGKKWSGISDLIWVGNALIDASNCCSEANTFANPSPIVVSEHFFNEIKDFETKNNCKKYSSFFQQLNGKNQFRCNCFINPFYNWVSNELIKGK